MIAFFDCGDELFSVAEKIENYVLLIYMIGVPDDSFLSFDRPGRPNHNRTGNLIMRMISEKAVALLLAVVVSGAAFNTFIV